MDTFYEFEYRMGGDAPGAEVFKIQFHENPMQIRFKGKNPAFTPYQGRYEVYPDGMLLVWFNCRGPEYERHMTAVHKTISDRGELILDGRDRRENKIVMRPLRCVRDGKEYNSRRDGEAIDCEPSDIIKALFKEPNPITEDPHTLLERPWEQL